MLLRVVSWIVFVFHLLLGVFAETRNEFGLRQARGRSQFLGPGLIEKIFAPDPYHIIARYLITFGLDLNEPNYHPQSQGRGIPKSSQIFQASCFLIAR